MEILKKIHFIEVLCQVKLDVKKIQPEDFNRDSDFVLN